MISIIIPAYNEEGVIGKTLLALKVLAGETEAEIIVVDGGSTDSTVAEARHSGATVIHGSRKGRSTQMNEGAAISRGAVLYFLHADTLPPEGFARDIEQAVEAGYKMGCYRLRFDHGHWFLKANAWFTRFDVNAFRFGDQSLFVARDVFERSGGFCEDHVVMEDQELVKRLRSYGSFTILKKHVITSARKYLENGVYRMQAIFYLLFILYSLGIPQHRLVSLYRNLVRQDKL